MKRPISLLIIIGLFLVPVQGQKKTPTDQPTFGHDPGGQRYATLTQINATNVTKIVRAWTYHIKPANAAPPAAEANPRGPRRRSNPESQAVPLVVNGVMYLTTAYRRVVALEPETGKCRWEYEIKKGEAATRGLEYWAGDANAAALVLRHLQRRIDRAFDSKTGKELWVTKIDAGAHSAPITYLGKDGKQYVVITATGGGFIADPSSADAVLAFALP